MPSSVIRDWTYDSDAQRLRITFTLGEVYDYEAVPPEIDQGLRDAQSKGRFFSRHIRDHFVYRRVT
ncbi:KTSC domain-containing protein [Brevundimonas sp. 2R-24]|uniref:KTSC domain-containing protein n=1 Tax=Peiella sedimenti TaxID=3061083 RepID=A0ABT8SLR1_9CAUL|nr:KTSC domain-containing protein [Caulobacteraceae bacterium XZ-24]